MELWPIRLDWMFNHAPNEGSDDRSLCHMGDTIVLTIAPMKGATVHFCAHSGIALFNPRPNEGSDIFSERATYGETANPRSQ